MTPLSPRQRQIIGLIAAGSTVKDVAITLRCQEGTVRGHIRIIMAKMQVRTLMHAAVVWSKKRRKIA